MFSIFHENLWMYVKQLYCSGAALDGLKIWKIIAKQKKKTSFRDDIFLREKNIQIIGAKIWPNLAQKLHRTCFWLSFTCPPKIRA